MDPKQTEALAPDSWDSLDDPGPGGDTKQLATSLTALKLNANAKPFVPNVNAPTFVPSFMKTEPSGKLPLAYVIVWDYDR